MSSGQNSSPSSASMDAVARAYRILEGVPDPEIPVLNVLELGVIRSLEIRENGAVQVGIAPTYSGCPALTAIRASVIQALQREGFDRVSAVDVLSPPWSSDWISESGRRKLREYGIAPPNPGARTRKRLLPDDMPIACPRCGSSATQKISEFGSTPCKAHYRCTACLEPFDYFKCI